MTNPLPADLQTCVETALAEDVGSGDVTAALVGESTAAEAFVIARERAILCGRPWFDEVFRQIVPKAELQWIANDGDELTENQRVVSIRGPAQGLLTAERTALNFLQTLSGTATVTAHYATLVAGTSCRVLDTRKTLPGLRTAQKYAVATGGGTNHRMGLFDAVLIKENHITSAGDVAAAINASRLQNPSLPIEVEVETLEQLKAALSVGVERILLDNFSLNLLAEAVALNRGFGPAAAKLEASGNMTEADLADVAATGVDYISVGALTKHVRATDYSMRFRFV
ncbi:MAG: carboxylating nicotinate-nucleotide diphosphorylase [Pseudomonadota bacterium]